MKYFSHLVGVNSKKWIKFWTYVLQLATLSVKSSHFNPYPNPNPNLKPNLNQNPNPNPILGFQNNEPYVQFGITNLRNNEPSEERDVPGSLLTHSIWVAQPS